MGMIFEEKNLATDFEVRTASPYNSTEVEAENREEEKSEFDFFSVWRRKRGKIFLFQVEISWSENFCVLL